MARWTKGFATEYLQLIWAIPRLVKLETYRRQTVNFPKHFGGLTLAHNGHRAFLLTAKEWIEENEASDHDSFFVWVSLEKRERAIATDSIWTLQWWSLSPINACRLAASDVTVLLDAANLQSADGATGYLSGTF